MNHIVAYVAGDLGEGVTERWVPFKTMEECEQHVSLIEKSYDFATITIATIDRIQTL